MDTLDTLNSRTAVQIDLEVDFKDEETCRSNLITYEAHKMTPVWDRYDERTNKHVRWDKVLQAQEAFSQKDMAISIKTLDEGEPVDKKFKYFGKNKRQQATQLIGEKRASEHEGYWS